MNREYSVNILFTDRDQFQNFIENVGPMIGSMVVSVVGAIPLVRPAEAPSAPPKVRHLRGSKVNATILAALQNGTQTIKQLKDALEAAELAPGSLSTGLASLQRTGEVERVGEGLYGLKMQAAAE